MRHRSKLPATRPTIAVLCSDWLGQTIQPGARRLGFEDALIPDLHKHADNCFFCDPTGHAYVVAMPPHADSTRLMQ